MNEQHTNNQALPTGFDAEMQEIFESFVVESTEILERLGRDLVDLEKNPTEPEILNNIFRGMHTLKGTSSFLGFAQMAELAHASEDLLNKLRKREVIVTREMMDVLFESYDAVKTLLKRIEARNLQPLDIEHIVRSLRWASEQTTPEQALVSPDMAGAKPAQSVVVPDQSGPTPQHAVDSTIRVDVDRLDNLMNLVGELVLARNRLAQAAHVIAEKSSHVESVKNVAEASSQIDFVTTELQMAVMKTRMVPIEKIFNRLHRLVREVARVTDREVDLQIYGKATELDKSIIEELSDPLVHLVRNAIDHGIEPSAERTAKGKPAMGALVVSAEHEGNHILITIEDDGRGIDPDVLKQRARERGLITEEQAREMSKREALNLIFIPGFTTASQVTSVSGRGVGMDVVRTNISRLKGIIDVSSEIGKGTVVTLKVPLTLAILQGLLVSVRKEVFAIPLASVLEVVRVEPHEIETIKGREVLNLRNSVLPLARMSDVLGMVPNGSAKTSSYVVVVGWIEQRIGLIVDSLLGQKEIVIKTLGSYLGDVRGIAGSTILGDGRVILIIDVGQFMELCAQRISGKS